MKVWNERKQQNIEYPEIIIVKCRIGGYESFVGSPYGNIKLGWGKDKIEAEKMGREIFDLHHRGAGIFIKY